MQKIVVLISGGMDSTTLLHHCRRMYGYNVEIHALSVFYGQRHHKEMACARSQAERANAILKRIDLSVLREALWMDSVLVGGADVPNSDDVPEADRNQPPTYVPARNCILLSVAVGYAEAVGADRVYYGAHMQDEYGYWDCTPEYVRKFNELLSLNRKHTIQIICPFENKTKSDIVLMANQLGVDLGDTWTCYKGLGKPCGHCATCTERLGAFARAGLVDPVEYDRDAHEAASSEL